MKKKLLVSNLNNSAEVEFNFERIGTSDVAIKFQTQDVCGHIIHQGSHNEFDVINLNGKNHRVKRIGDFISMNGKNFKVQTPSSVLAKKSGGAGNMTSPMPGKILKVMVKPGDSVEKGQGLLVMEAMKMEHTIKATHTGVVKGIFYHEGDLVDGGVDLIDLEAEL